MFYKRNRVVAGWTSAEALFNAAQARRDLDAAKASLRGELERERVEHTQALQRADAEHRCGGQPAGADCRACSLALDWRGHVIDKRWPRPARLNSILCLIVPLQLGAGCR